MTKYIRYIFFAVAACLFLTACEDDFDVRQFTIGEGDANIHFSIRYDAEDQVDMGRAYNFENNFTGGAPGQSIQNISKLSMFVYDAEGNLMGDRIDILPTPTPGVVVNVNDSSNVDNTIPSDGNNPDKKTGKVEFDLKMTSGRYYIYAVANVDNIGQYASQYATREGLKNISFNWQTSDVTLNSQMFGVFTREPNRGATDDNTIIVPATNVTLHSWVRRLASKVTVAFDGSELFDGVEVYVSDIQIKDIPSRCFLGRNNSPGMNADSTNVSRSLMHDENYIDHLIYNGMKIQVQQMPPGVATLVPDNFLHVCKRAHPYLGKGSDRGDTAAIHAVTSPALYFYENIQGTGTNKAQSLDGSTIEHPEPDSTKVNSGWKNEKAFGTWIEVQAYYKCTFQDGSVSQGPIVYRFMLGRNIKNDYSCVRNTHYKLTLKLKGYANQYNWNIDYDEPGDILAQSPQFISYLYNKKMVTVVTVKGEIDPDRPYIFAEIGQPTVSASGAGWSYSVNGDSWAEKTYWRPWGDGSEKFPNPIGKSDPYDPAHPFYYQGDTNRDGPWVSFLTLREPHVIRLSPAGYDYQNSRAYAASDPQGFIYSNWGRKPESVPQEPLSVWCKGWRAYRIGDPNTDETQTMEAAVNGDGSYTVRVTRRKPAPAGQLGEPVERVFTIPLYTRAKEIVTSTGYTGGNPYQAYPRKSKVRFFAYVRDGDTYKEKEVFVDIIQVRRVVNPTGVVRSDDCNDPFHVTLMTQLDLDETANYQPIISYGDWSAEIMDGSDDICVLTSTAEGSGGSYPQVATKRIQGIDQGKVDFRIEFTGTKGFAAIRVRYHNYTCEHDIFVRKGYTDDVELNGKKWASRNVRRFTTGNVPEFGYSPLDEGSLFRRGSYIAIRNTHNNSHPPVNGIVAAERFRATYNKDPSLYNSAPQHWLPNNPPDFSVYLENGTLSTKSWAGCAAASGAASITTWTVSASSPYRFPRADDFYTAVPLQTNSADHDIGFVYGVLYGDGAIETAVSPAVATGYVGEADGPSSPKGMLGIFLFNRHLVNGNGYAHVFFPMGAHGYGRRKNGSGWKNNDPNGYLRYASRSQFFGYYKADQGTMATLPFFYDLYRRPGAVYWCRERENTSNGSVSTITKSSAFDMNFFTMGFEGFENGACVSTNGQDSDACFIRLISDN